MTSTSCTKEIYMDVCCGKKCQPNSPVMQSLVIGECLNSIQTNEPVLWSKHLSSESNILLLK